MKACIFTVEHDESYYLPIFLKWYGETFKPEDVYILAHNASDKHKKELERAEKDGYKVEHLTTDEIFNHDWLNMIVHGRQRQLLEEYDYVMFVDCDELVVPTECTLREFIDNATEEAYRCDGWEIQEDIHKYIGNKFMYRSIGFCKTPLTRIPLTYVHGYHRSEPEFQINDKLRLYHIHKLNWNESWARNQRISQENWDKYAIANNLGTHNNISGEQEYKDFWIKEVPSEDDRHPVPKDVLDRL